MVLCSRIKRHILCPITYLFISDVRLVEESGFLQVVPQNCTILADRGFKHLDANLNKQHVKLLRPPSVYSDLKPTKEEVLTTKVIASLRVHIE